MGKTLKATMNIMKIQSFIIIAVFCTVVSCNKDDFSYPKDTVGISKIIYFPSIAINGDRLIILKRGDSYSELGAKALLNGDSVSYKTTGQVNTSIAGVYDLTYTAVDAQGYSASDFRTVVIIGNDVTNNDFSGTYLRTGFATSTWTKTANGIYTVENPGGATAGAGLTVIAVNYTGDKIKIPHQISPDLAEVRSQDETYDTTANPVTYSWEFIAGGYGAYLRTFIKQ